MSKPKEVELKARVTVEMKNHVQAIADRRGESISVVVREALGAYLVKQPETAKQLIERKLKDVFGEPSEGKSPRKKKSAPTKEKRARLRDIREVSLSIFANIAAGWPQDGRAMKPKRTVMVPKGKYPASAFGLDVVGDSMDAATGKFGRILPGETVVLVPFECCDKASGQIVAALVDGKTTLKRLECLPDDRCLLTAESTNPRNPRSINPSHDLVIQGVVIGKL